MPNVKDPMNQRDTIYFKTIDGEHPCTESSKTLYFCKRFPDHIEIHLAALKQNTRAVKLEFSDRAARAIFKDPPDSPVILARGQKVTLTIKKNVGTLKSRSHFGDPHHKDFPEYGRLFQLSFDRCPHSRPHDDVHVEC